MATEYLSIFLRSLSIGCPQGNLRDMYELYLLQDVFQQTKQCFMPLLGHEAAIGCEAPANSDESFKKDGRGGR